uniref:Brachyury 1 SciBra1 n=1 Tax=Sycon ciliatum TaxID=27933 RepID=A0A077SQS7_9METZ|nr:Brachyury 1 SciBra1 [Sycon ciliatum]|eukprot:scpid51433/ scgid3014/ Brachyury protein homolog A; No tail protein A; Protein T homolog A; T-box protein ZfT
MAENGIGSFSELKLETEAVAAGGTGDLRGTATPASPPAAAGATSSDGVRQGSSYLRDSTHQAAPAMQGGQLVTIQLENVPLWEEFRTCPTEMVVTRQGRRMFPVVTVSVKGLRPEAMYSVFMDMILVDNHRWKYVRGEWVSGGKADQPHATIYKHPDSPHYGSHWVKSPISFSKVKLTNRIGEGHLVLNSLHKYEARVHVVPEQGQCVHPLPSIWKSFRETQFIAVTAYQNEEVTQLKIKNNPYAKAFTEAHKKTRVVEEQFRDTSGLQLIQPHRPFTDELVADDGEMSDVDECVSPNTVAATCTPQIFLAPPYEADFPPESLSAPQTLKRDESMEVDEQQRNSHSLPVDSAPQAFPSTYYIRQRNGQITLCDQVQPQNMHVPLSPHQPSPSTAGLMDQQAQQQHPPQPVSPLYMNIRGGSQSPGIELCQQHQQQHQQAASMHATSPTPQQLTAAINQYQYSIMSSSPPPGQLQTIPFPPVQQHLSPSSPDAAGGQAPPPFSPQSNPTSPQGPGTLRYIPLPVQQPGYPHAFPQQVPSTTAAASTHFPLVPSGQMHPLLPPQYASPAQHQH